MRVLAIDGVGLSVIVALAWAMASYWIIPNQAQAGRLRVARHQARVAESAIEEHGARRSRLTARLNEQIDALETRYQTLPLSADVSAQIASIGAKAGSVQLTLNEMLPGPVEPAGPYATATVRLKAVGTLDAFLAWLAMAHETMPALDLTELSLKRLDGSDAALQIEWNVALLLRTRSEGPRESLRPAEARGGP
jgi:hypothetical protein